MTLAAVTDRRRLSLTVDALVERAGWLAAGGVDLIQLRERDLSDRALFETAVRILQACRGTSTRVLVNDRTDIAIAAAADGVHLRGDSIPAPRVRAIAPSGFLVGRSVHAADEAVAVEAAGGCDYLLFGTVFQSSGKPSAPVTGIDALAAVVRQVRTPVLAIGGIVPARAPLVAGAGAAGVAAVDAFWRMTSAAAARDAVSAMRRAFDSRSAVQ